MQRRRNRRLVVLAPLLLGVSPTVADAQATAAQVSTDPDMMAFICTEGSLRLRTEVRDGAFVAIVFDDGTFVLPVKPWTFGDPPVVTWSDGVRTLSWSPGVELHWRVGASQKTCFNGLTHGSNRAAGQ